MIFNEFPSISFKLLTIGVVSKIVSGILMPPVLITFSSGFAVSWVYLIYTLLSLKSFVVDKRILLATGNVTDEISNVSTASFNKKSSLLYDLFSISRFMVNNNLSLSGPVSARIVNLRILRRPPVPLLLPT